MDSSQASSFIPKSPMSGTLNKRRVRKVYIFTYLIYIFFVGSLLAAAGTWFYKVSVQNDLAAVQLALNEEREKFNQSELEKVSELDVRINQAKEIFDRQVSVVQILEAVERITLASVDMQGFLFKKDINTKLVLELSAEASDFNTTLFQRQVLSGDEVLGGSEVTGVTYTNTPASAEAGAQSVVLFKVEKDVLPGTIKPKAQVISASDSVAVPSSSSDALSAAAVGTSTGSGTVTPDIEP